MKYKALGFIVATALATALVWNNQQDKEGFQLSGIALENIEALAQGEWGTGGPCYSNYITIYILKG